MQRVPAAERDALNVKYGAAPQPQAVQDYPNLLSWVKSNPGRTITSGYRDPRHNRAVGGVANSYHTRKNADGTSMAYDFVSKESLDQVRRSLPPGYEVIQHNVGSGMHFHVEPAPGGKPKSKTVSNRVTGAERDRLNKLYGSGSTMSPVAQRQLQGLYQKTPPKPLNAIDRLGAGFRNAASGFTQDEQAKQATGLAGAIGTTTGSLVPMALSGLTGAGLGALGFTPFTVAGGAIGGVAAGGAGVGAAQEAQRQRLEGLTPNYGKIAGAGVIGGLSSLPWGGAASTAGKAFIKNALIDTGINVAGDYGMQSLEKETIDPRKMDWQRLGVAAGIGAAGGALASAAHAKLRTHHPEIAAELDQTAQVSEVQMRKIADVLTNEEASALRAAWDKRTEKPQVIRQPFTEGEALQKTGLQRPVTEKVSDTGLTVTREGLTKEPTKLAIDRGFPEGTPIEQQPQGLRSQVVIDPKTGNPYAPTPEYLRPAEAIALDNAQRMIDEPTLPTPPREGLTLKGDPSAPSGLLDASGRLIEQSADTPTGLVRPDGMPLSRAGLDMPEIIRPKADTPSIDPTIRADETPNVVRTENGAEVYMNGRTEEQTQSLIQSIQKARQDGTQQQLLTEQQANELIDAKLKAGLLDQDAAQKQKDILALAIEAGRTGRGLITSRREIEEGLGTLSRAMGKDEIKNRDSLAVFGLTHHMNKPQTEVGNLMKQFGGRDSNGKKTATFGDATQQVINHLGAIAQKYGITPTRQGRTQEAIARNIVAQIQAHPQGKLEFTDVALQVHNYKTGGARTGTDAPRSYPLRTIESANVGENAVNIPEGAVYQNRIAKARNDIRALAEDTTIPADVKKSLDAFVNNGPVTKADRARVRALLESSPEQLAKFCQILGL